MATNVSVIVRDNNIEKALRELKRGMIRGGVFKDAKEKQYYVSKGQKRAEKKRKGVQRAFKAAVRQTMARGMVDKPTAIEIVKRTRSPR